MPFKVIGPRNLKGGVQLRISTSGRLRARLDLLRASYDDGARSGRMYKLIQELQQELDRAEKRKPRVDRPFVQNAWPIKAKRPPRK